MKKIISLIKKIFLIGTSSFINFCKFKYHGVKYAGFPRTRGVLLISSSKKNSICFGKHITINSGRKRNPVGMGIQTSIIALDGGHIKIGDHVGMSNVAIVSGASITVENNVLLGNGTTIYDTDFHSIRYEDRCQKPETNIACAPVLIKEGAFIGAGSIILKNVTIGKHSVVGAGSVVAKSIPDGEVWAGNPAKFIKKIG